ncbi:hypothetical protein GCM10007981_02520 [Thermocladium modestius]|uniref:CBS domain-containing protein n=1 Tax=Thermocladium modestius TaxID=62609 RepID=A0A830GR85_9CREN|nr:CBS domain-containing protein [Thermocladium modestius]GGP19318.1 hypothetical protein GCM10007981_02520 [Thermocladium modestius]
MSSIRDLIRKPTVVVGLNDKLSSVITSMREGRVFIAPVVNDNNKLVGILSYRELLRRRVPINSKASSVMSRPFSISESSSFERLIIKLHETKAREVPVVDDKNNLVGIIRRIDVINSIAPSLPKVDVSRAMSSPPITIGSNENVATARWLMVKHGISLLPVIQDGKLIGMITLTDLVEKIFYASTPRRARRGEVEGEEEKILAAPVASVMQEAATIDKSRPIADAIEKLNKHDGLIVTGDGVVGVLTGSDIVRLYVESSKVSIPITARINDVQDKYLRQMIERAVNNHLEKIAKITDIIDFKVDIRAKAMGNNDKRTRYEVAVRLKDSNNSFSVTSNGWDAVETIKDAMETLLKRVERSMDRMRSIKRREERPSE